MKQDLPEEFLRLCGSVKSKRPRTVIEHIIEHGFITTEELKNKYGYNHPPRAARDVREQGIPLETFRIVASDKRSIAAYRFADLSKVRADKLSGRTVISKAFKQKLIEHYSSKCAIHNDLLDERYLQVDHRVPFLVAGDVPSSERNVNDYMLLCGSANRAKSWSCEHCVNGLELKDEAICKTCYWASPEEYSHIAMQDIRRVDIIWSGEEVEEYDRLKRRTEELHQDVPSYVKEIIKKYVADE
ncbi:MAG: hypothetical protein WBP93_01870 [Pyrinomonadaceae bacterium]